MGSKQDDATIESVKVTEKKADGERRIFRFDTDQRKDIVSDKAGEHFVREAREEDKGRAQELRDKVKRAGLLP